MLVLAAGTAAAARRLDTAVPSVPLGWVVRSMSGQEPSTPVRQDGGKRLFVHSPHSAAKHTAVGAAFRSFLDSPAVSPPQGPGAANPHLQEQRVVDDESSAAAAADPTEPEKTMAAGVEALLRRAADSVSSDPVDIMAEEIVADARRSMQ